jgi:hypothetical protein
MQKRQSLAVAGGTQQVVVERAEKQKQLEVGQ